MKIKNRQLVENQAVPAHSEPEQLDEEPVFEAIVESVDRSDPDIEEPMQHPQRDRRPPQVFTYYGPGQSFERPAGNVSYVYATRLNPMNFGLFYAYLLQNYLVQY